MNRHRFDPLSLVLGVVVVAMSMAVAFGPPERLTLAEPIWWIAIPTFLVGIAVIPRRGSGSAPIPAAPDRAEHLGADARDVDP